MALPLTINGGLTVNGEATNQGQLVVSSDEDSSGSLIANNQVGDLELTYERTLFIEMATGIQFHLLLKT